MTFSKWLNNEFLPENPSYSWIKESIIKSRKTIHLQRREGLQELLQKTRRAPSLAINAATCLSKCICLKNGPAEWTTDGIVLRYQHLASFGSKEYGYIPPGGAKVISGTVSRDAGRYFVSVLCKTEISKETYNYSTEGIGIDLGIKSLLFAVMAKPLATSIKPRK